MSTDTLGLIDAATVVRLQKHSAEGAQDIVDGLTHDELRHLIRSLIELVGIARTWRGGPPEQPAPDLKEWCTAIINRQGTLTADQPAEAPDRPRRKARDRSSRIRLREAFEAGPYTSSDPFGAGLESDDDDD